MQAELIKYANKCFRSLGFNLILVASDNTIEPIHRLRLNVKKIRTLLKILDYKHNIKNGYKTVKALNNIFTYSGSLRDIQIQIQLLKKFKEQAEDHFHNIMQMHKAELRKEEVRLKCSIKKLNQFDIILLNQRIEQLIEDQNSDSLTLLLQQKAESLKTEFICLMKDDIGENSLHRIRIVLKEYINIFNLLRKGTGSNQKNTSYLEKLDNLQRRIGEWHDLTLLYECLITRGLNIQSLIDIIKNERDKLKIEIKENLLKTEI